MIEYKTNNNKNKKGKRKIAQVSLNNFVPTPPYHVMLRFYVQPGSAASTITGLTPQNLGKALSFTLFAAAAYNIPANGVLAPTGSVIFRYMKIKRVDLWGPSTGNCKLALNATTTTLSYPKPTIQSESYGVTNKPHQTLYLNKPFNMVVDATSSSSTELFLVSYEQSTIAAVDNTVILQFEMVVYG